MRFDLNAEEIIALYDNLHDHVTRDGNADPLLNELFNRVKACMIAALSSKERPSIEELYLSKQREKIDDLVHQNAEIGKQLQRPIMILTDDAGGPAVPAEHPKKVSATKGHKKKG